MWAAGLLVLLLLLVGVGGAIFVPSTLIVGWIALFVTALLGIGGLLLISWIVRLLMRVSIGEAVSPAGDRLGKLIAITFAAVAVTSIPLFVWDVGVRVLFNVFGRNPGYQNLSQLAAARCSPSEPSCIVGAINNSFATLLRYFQSLLADLSLSQLPLVDLLWFIVAAALMALVIALFRSAINRANDQSPLDVVRHMIPEGLRRRLPVVILLIAAFYLGLSAMFAIPVLRNGADIGLSSSAVNEDRLRPPNEMVDRLNKLDIGLTPIEFSEAPVRADAAPADAAGVVPPAAAAARASAADRMQTARTYAANYDRQRDEFRRVLDGAPSRLRQLSVETTALASSSPRAFLGKRDKDRFVAAVIDYYQATISRYEIGLYNCRKALIEFREEIEQFRSGRQDNSLTFRLLALTSGTGPVASGLDKPSVEALRTCQSANNPERISPKIPPDPFELLGPFGATVRWLVTTDSRPIATIVGMIGFGLLGATLSRMIRKSEQEEGQLAGLESFFVVAGGVTAALVVFLGSYAILGDQTSEPNPYIVFVTCLVGAVFSEDIWSWARERFLPKKEAEAKEKEAKEKEAAAGASESSGNGQQKSGEEAAPASGGADAAADVPKAVPETGADTRAAGLSKQGWSRYVPEDAKN